MTNTWPSNAHTHSGEWHNKYSVQQCPVEEVQAKREAIAAVKEKMLAEKETGKKSAAELGHITRQKQQLAKTHSGASNVQLDIPRARNVRPAANPVSEG